MCTKPDCDVLITYRLTSASTPVTRKCSEMDPVSRRRYGCEAVRRAQARAAISADPLILYRERTDRPALPTRLSEIPEERRPLYARAFGEVKACVSCQHCRIPADARASDYRCDHPLSVDRVSGHSLACDFVRRHRGICGTEGEFWEPISATEERCA